jgi:phage repressor protein C with HTH and peptisase S24 domain
MAFRVEDLQALVRLLREHPEWRDELRRALLPEDTALLAREVAALAAEVRGLAEAQRRTDATVQALAEAQARTEERLRELAEAQRELAEAQKRTEHLVQQLAEAQRQTDLRLQELAEAQKRTEQRVEELAQAQARAAQRIEELAQAQARTEQRIEELAQAQMRTEQRVEELAQAQTRTEVTLQALVETVRVLVKDVATLKGDSLERLYRDRAASYFARVLRRIRTMGPDQLGLLLDEAVDAGRITLEEREDVLQADVVVEGRRHGETVYLVVEVSWEVRSEDVERAVRRATVLQRAVAHPALPAVAGKVLAPDQHTQQLASKVWRVLDGKTEPPAG